MKKITPLNIFLFVVFTTNISLAQIDTTLKPGWNPKGVVGIGLSQVALSNWQKGGENVISISGYSDFAENYFSSPWILKNRLLLNLGSTKTGGTSFRTNDNGLLLEMELIR